MLSPRKLLDASLRLLDRAAYRVCSLTGLRMVSKILNYPTDGHTLAQELGNHEEMLQGHMEMQGKAMTYEHLQHRTASMEWVNEIILSNKAYISSVRRTMNTARQALSKSKKGFEPVPHLLRINAKFKLGGVLLLQDDFTKELADDEEPEWDSRDIMMRLIVGIHISPKDDAGVLYKPPFLRYAYVPETPVMLEGWCCPF